MPRLVLLAIAWLLFFYQYSLTVDWIWTAPNIWPCLSEFKIEYTVNTAKTVTRVFCLLYLVWHVTYYFCSQYQYRMHLDRVTYFMTHYKVPKPIQDRVLQSYQQAWSENKIKFPISKLGLYILPQVLHNVLIAHVGKTVLEKLKMYHQCFDLLTSIASKVRTLNYYPGDIVCRKGTVADNIYLVADGILKATTDAGEHLETLSSGDIVGEIGALHIDGYNIRTANVHSVTDSEVFAIKQKDINEIINKFPDAKKIMVNIGKRRLLRSKTMPL